MSSFDLIIVGGGMVGLSLAAALADSELRVALVDKGEAPVVPSGEFSHRVSALNHASDSFLQRIGAWQYRDQSRLTAYREMAVWEKDSFAKIGFNSDGLGVDYLGHIVENSHLCYALHQRLTHATNIQLMYGVAPEKLTVGERDAWLLLDSGEPISAPLVVAGDGANSWLRKQAQLPLTFWDYDHHAIVATVKTEQPHQSTAYQIFSASGPLAFLPLPDPHLSSIVWSLPPSEAQRLTSLPLDEFNKALASAFDMRLGLCETLNAPVALPLTMRYARDWSCDRVVLMGDAAHTIHPLAGQGVNLGFKDASALATHLLALQAAHKDLGQRRHLRSYERERKAETVAMIAAMEGIKRLFSLDIAPLKFVRGIGMRGVDELSPLKSLLAKLAIRGVTS
ncbi:FAD-dependent oxidoreductase [Corallincola holothuriorum]|uniref:FAD-dependent oxidoreductase n=1 Tax=Corallincola holothuriorum TaxID=2282215 RepID=A0A368N7U1_9GAMM|nr:FAD-dependent oxidoreductase [Corallincola holothuriorum]RCU45671.1 FAD-dependent oxidoreductase [Corallincola holothuriorum]